MFRSVTSFGLLMAVTGFGAAGSAQAAALSWSGVNGQWFTPAEWGGSVPNLTAGTDTATISSGFVTYTPGGDFVNNSMLTIGSGATWQQTSAVAWSFMGNGTGTAGTLNVSGTFDLGGAGQWQIGRSDGTGTGTVNVTGGTVKANATFIRPGSAVTVSAGGLFQATSTALAGTGKITLNGAGSTYSMTGAELKPNGANVVEINGGLLKAANLGFDAAGSNYISISSGRIELSNGTHFDGVFSLGADDYVNFVGSSGTLFLGNSATTTNANNLLNSGRVRYNGTANPTQFVVTTVTGGVEISLNVPEPVSFASLALVSSGLLRRRRAR